MFPILEFMSISEIKIVPFFEPKESAMGYIIIIMLILSFTLPITVQPEKAPDHHLCFLYSQPTKGARSHCAFPVSWVLGIAEYRGHHLSTLHSLTLMGQEIRTRRYEDSTHFHSNSSICSAGSLFN